MVLLSHTAYSTLSFSHIHEFSHSRYVEFSPWPFIRSSNKTVFYSICSRIHTSTALVEPSFYSICISKKKLFLFYFCSSCLLCVTDQTSKLHQWHIKYSFHICCICDRVMEDVPTTFVTFLMLQTYLYVTSHLITIGEMVKDNALFCAEASQQPWTYSEHHISLGQGRQPESENGRGKQGGFGQQRPFFNLLVQIASDKSRFMHIEGGQPCL